MLFVALVRAMGLPVRYVRLMDVLPVEPWKRRPAVTVAGAGVSRAVLSPREAVEREAQHQGRLRQLHRWSHPLWVPRTETMTSQFARFR